MSLVGFKSSNHPQQVGKRGATDRDDLGTDPALFARLAELLGGFTLDVAATPANAKCSAYYTKEIDGLTQPWKGRVWCNPPYSQIEAWLEKAWKEWGQGPPWCDLIAMLLPANRCEQGWWHKHVEPYRDHNLNGLRVIFLKGRQRFVLPGAEEIGPNERPPFGCCVLVWSDSHYDYSGRTTVEGERIDP